MTGTQSRSIPKAQWHHKAGLIAREGDQDTQEEDQEGDSEEDQENEGDPIEEQQDIPRKQYITISGRVSKAPERLGMTTFESILEPYDYEELDEWCEKDLFAFKASEQVSMKASTDPDTMYYHQAMREPDRELFKKAIRKECEDHFRESNYKLVSIDQVPKDATLLSSVWQMKRKRKPLTGEISQYKARMNVDGSKMIKGIHYEETYAPVVAWATIRFFLTLAVINNWHTRQLDFLLAFTQADIERDQQAL
jgi:hypothetical protein